jgi:hypothetical protein
MLQPLAVVLALIAQEAGAVEVMTCRDDATQRYALHLPKAYHRGKVWPIVYCFAPDANGNYFVEKYKAACDEVGWIAAGSLNSKNADEDQQQRAMKSLWTDTHARFSIDDRRCFASGLSGGALVAIEFASRHKDQMAGVFAMAMGSGSISPKGMAVWLSCGDTDYNRPGVEATYERLKTEKGTVDLKIFKGGHVISPDDLLHDSILWMAKQKPPKLEEAKKALDAGEKALADKTWKKAIAAFTAAARSGDSRQQDVAIDKLQEIELVAIEMLKALEDEKDASKKRAVLQKVKAEFDGLDIAEEAATRLREK